MPKYGANKNALHKGIAAVGFGLLSSDEIKKASVLKVWAPLSFNQYGRPLQGGLYDGVMGPTSDKGVLCNTCFRTSFFCPGHMGHIELPVPVVNPMFRTQLSKILRICCVKCYKTLIPDFVKYLLIARLRLLEMGFSTAAVDAERVVANPDPKLKDNEAIAIWARDKLEEYITEVCTNGKIETCNPTKNYEALRRLFIDTALHSVSNALKKCSHCKVSLKRYILYQCRFMTNLNKVDVAQKFSEEKDSKGMDKLKNVRSRSVTVPVRADELRDHMRNIWINEQEIAEVLFPMLKRKDIEFPTDLFFLDTIPVPPPNTRPVNFVDGKVVEHPQSFALKQILQNVIMIQNVAKALQLGDENLLSNEGKNVLKELRGASLQEKMSTCWDDLQADVDHLLDKYINKSASSDTCVGIKQVIEKKEGIFRMHMMGKRVNFAARSVITPDPNLNVDEIGIPEAFALKLTYPVPVTPWNVEELRKLVLNGPNVHPGAVAVQNEDGSTNLIRGDNIQQREAVAKKLLTPPGRARYYTGPKIVHRHLNNGDVMLLNRQPTLHRPSIMAHKARVLKGEKTIRLHYANCSSYNADFDGDEMNAHFPQNELARSEGYNIVNVCHQYLVPKSGTPLSGLIQDHVVSGVRLTTRGRFFTREDYQQLVYQGLSNIPGTIRLLPPSILKPQCLWSGKQVLSTVLLNVIPRDKPPLSLEDSAKIGAKAWEIVPARKCTFGGSPLDANDMSEAEVVIHGGELLCGVLDKKHYGATPFGLVHCVYELYGGEYSAKLLSALAKLFTAFLQTEGFTLGVADILVLKKADKKRSSYIKQARQLGEGIVREALELDPNTPFEEVKLHMKNMFSKDESKYQATLDRKYKSALDQVTNEINKACLPAGLVNKFPINNLQLMVQSGAKGSTVNTMQISCLLGQIELEGKRPPLMISGKSLPSFEAFDTSPRAGGFVEGRFMTGIKPQEFFFHCMAGREGLIDTAVKTSRSGYLQRCLVKHLEGLVVCYDQTVRDSDGSVIQYYYGEDGMDVCKAQFLTQKQLPVLCNNSKILSSGKNMEKLLQASDQEQLASAKKELNKWRKKHPEGKHRQGGFLEFSHDMAESMRDKEVKLSKKTGRTNITKKLVKAWQDLDPKSRKRYEKSSKLCPDPISSAFRLDQSFGAVTEKLDTLINKHVIGERREDELRELLYYKSMLSQAPAGEPVGILAAQSVGEPSTQMTLNTFHFAGRGDMNVTLGIPRLRELFMMASKNQSTPAMDIPFLSGVSESKAEKLRIVLTKVTLSDVLEKISVTERVDIGSTRQYTFKVRFSFLPRSSYKLKYPLKPKSILRFMEFCYFASLETAMKKAMKLKQELISSQKDQNLRQKAEKGEEDDDDDGATNTPSAKPVHIGDVEDKDSSDEEGQADDEDATMARSRSRHTENREYEDPEEVEVEQESDNENDNMIEQDGLSEAATEANPDSDKAHEHDEELFKDSANTNFSARVFNVKTLNKFIQSYEYDLEDELWCEVIIGVSLDMKKVDMASILRSTAEKSIIWQVPNINKAFTYRNANQELILKVDGINIPEMYKHHKYLDLNRLYTNSVHGMAEMYGIEAASRVLVKEVQDVFQVYGITVDPRHLLLIADYMTYEGVYSALNRAGMNNNASPLQQMTFETSLAFLRTSVLEAKKDHIQSPSSCLITGQPCKVGTAVFDLLLQMNI